MPFFFNIIGWGPRASHPNIIAARSRRSALSCALTWVKPVDGRPESWPPFKKALHQLLDKEGYGWVVEGGDVFCAMLQAASGQEHRDIRKRHNLNKCRGLPEKGPPDGVHKRVGNDILAA
jgi:hypothetical protein